MAANAPNPLDALSEVIDVTGWAVDEEFEVHPVGTKPKRTLICPDEPPHPMLIPRHKYLFKLAEGWKGNQMWSEAIAYQLGCAVGLDVPPCFIARNAGTGRAGALIEFFYGYPAEVAPSRLIHGADLLQERGFTRGADRPHNLMTNVALCEDRGLAGAVAWWASTIAFDALIGNTDRHTENWGVLVGSTGDEQFAPRFDNGTSLAFQQPEAALDDLLDAAKLDHFIARGTGHLGWDEENDQRVPLLQLSERFAAIEIAGAATRNVIQPDLTGLAATVEACTGLIVAPAFSAQRAEVVLRSIERRQALLREVCGE